MVDFFSSFPAAIIAATLLGALAGMGIGGGSLLILWLTFVLGFSAEEARLINLMFFLPCALICTAFRLKKGTLPLKTVLPAAAVGCLCAFFAARLGLGDGLLRKLFGGLLIITGLREVFYRDKKAK